MLWERIHWHILTYRFTFKMVIIYIWKERHALSLETPLVLLPCCRETLWLPHPGVGVCWSRSHSVGPCLCVLNTLSSALGRGNHQHLAPGIHLEPCLARRKEKRETVRMERREERMKTGEEGGEKRKCSVLQKKHHWTNSPRDPPAPYPGLVHSTSDLASPAATKEVIFAWTSIVGLVVKRPLTLGIAGNLIQCLVREVRSLHASEQWELRVPQIASLLCRNEDFTAAAKTQCNQMNK